MLYSTGGVSIWFGCVTSYVGTISSQQIVQSTAVIAPNRGFTANASTPVTIKPPPAPPAVPGALANNNTPFQIVTANVATGGADPSLPPPGNDPVPQLGPPPQENQNNSLQALEVIGRGPPEVTINITRPVVINSVQLMYLGTGKRAPRVTIRRRFRPIYQSDSGRIIEYDKAYAGQDAIITMTLNNWNEYAYAILAARPNQRSLINGGPRGVDIVDSIGSLMLTEGLAYMLFLQYPLSAKARMTAGGMPAGYRFFAAYPLIEEMQPGLVTNELTLQWHALKLLDFSTGNQWLFDNDMSLVPQLTQF